jgi:hypothetical protein
MSPDADEIIARLSEGYCGIHKDELEKEHGYCKKCKAYWRCVGDGVILSVSKAVDTRRLSINKAISFTELRNIYHQNAIELLQTVLDNANTELNNYSK